MRISGYGTGGGYGGRKDRREAFRRKHAVGQRVTGTFVRRQSASLAWVEIDGQVLLAELGGDPQPGQRLFFVIERLVPEIVLKEIVPGKEGGGLVALVHAFWKQRQVFERLFLPAAETLSAERRLEPRKKRFKELLREDGAMGQAFEALGQRQQRLNMWLRDREGGRVLLAPWLLPQARDQELLALHGKELMEAGFSFVLPKMGHCELHVLFRPPHGRYQLLLEHPGQVPHVRESLAGILGEALGARLDSGDVAPLPPGRGSLLGELLAREAISGRPRFSTRV